MIQATTPTLRFRVKNKADETPVSFDGINEIYVTLQQGLYKLTKTGEDVSIDVNEVSVWLAQDETLRFDYRKPVKVQINWTYTDHISGKTQRAAAKARYIQVDEQLLQRVLE